MSQWYVRVRGRVMGPFALSEVREMRERGQLQPFHELSTDRASWSVAASVSEVFPSIRTRPDPMAQPMAVQPVVVVPPKRRRSLALPLAIAALLGLVGVMTLMVISIVVYKRGGFGTGYDDGSIRFSKDSNETEKDAQLASVVGLVVCGEEVTYADGSQTENRRLGWGTCFRVTPDGYLLTNRHVVEKVENERRSSERRDKEIRSGQKIRPQAWVFFSLTDKSPAEIVHISNNFDMAVLKIASKSTRYLALSGDNPAQIARGTSVLACGFPDVDGKVVSFFEAVSQAKKSQTKGPVERLFLDKAFGFSLRKGIVNVQPGPYRAEDWTRDAICLQHNAHIFRGNSGGPLLGDDGTVIGINTFGREPTDAPDEFNYSLTMPQMRTEIDRHAPGTLWR